jgi:pimeloyl-ACP methyl ester carboxylesterase
MEISWNGSSLYYTKTGSGNRVVVLFHGFGQDHSLFAGVFDALSEEFTSYSFDLFFHGRSNWAHGERPISIEEAKTFFEKFINREGIQRFSIIGYSIGCRFALACLAAKPQNVESLLLVAPDGLIGNVWYSMSTGSVAMRGLFRHAIRHPRLFRSIVRLVRFLRLAHPKALRFSEAMMRDSQRREKVFHSWVVFRRLGMTLTTLHDLVSKYRIKCFVILGRKDEIIAPAAWERKLNKLTNIELRHSDGSHHRMPQELPTMVKDILTAQNDSLR